MFPSQREEEGFSNCVGDIGSPLMMPEGGGRFYAQVINDFSKTSPLLDYFYAQVMMIDQI